MQKDIISEFNAIYEDCYSRIRTYAEYNLYNKNESDDIVQIVMTDVYKYLNDGHSINYPITFTSKLAHNAVYLTNLKYLAKKQKESILEDDEFLNIDNGYDTLKMFEERELLENIIRAANSLPKSQRNAFLLNTFSSMDRDKIHTILGTSDESVRANASRGLKQVRKALQKEGLI